MRSTTPLDSRPRSACRVRPISPWVAQPVPIGKVMLVCPKCDKPTRVGTREDGDKKKRFCKNCDALID